MRTPPKVVIVQYFPMVAETNIRKSFLTRYDSFRDELPAELEPPPVTGYITSPRRGKSNSHPVATG